MADTMHDFRIFPAITLLVALTLLAAPACLGGGRHVDDPDGSPDGDVDSDVDGDTDGDVDSDVDADVDGDADADETDGAPDGDVDEGLMIHIHIRATAEEHPHDDGLSGQTPTHHENGIRAFSMLRTRDDADPELVFDHGTGFVEAGYDDGDDTIVGSAPVVDVAEGHYTWGAVTISHMRYGVRATMHHSGLAVPGELENVQVLSDDTEIDGVVHDAGWFRYVYTAAGMSFPLEGETGAPILPAWPSGAPIETAFEEGQMVLYFPIEIIVDHRVEEDVHQVIEFNVHESFRWEDQEGAGYSTGVFDTTPTSFEPVRRFGANSYTHYVDGD